MKNFKILNGRLLRFDFNSVRYNSQDYIVLRNAIEEVSYSYNGLRLINEVIFELLGGEVVAGVNKLKYLTSLFVDLKQFVTDTTMHSFIDFITICNQLNIMVVIPINLFESVCTITDNLLDDILDDINCRLKIISDIQSALNRISTISHSETAIPSVDITPMERRALGDNLKPNELNYLEWQTITSQPNNFLDDQVNNNSSSTKPYQNTIDVKPTLLNYVEGKDRGLYDKIVNYYSPLKSPKTIFSMLQALEKERLLNVKIIDISNTEWTDIINRSFKVNFTRQSLFNPLRKHNTVDKEIAVIRTFI